MKQSLTVLVVEDNPGDARLVRELFRPFGECRLEYAGSLAAGLGRLEQGDVDAVLLDLGLPDAEGTEALERLRERCPDVATLVLTGRDDSEVAFEAVAGGAQDYLVKGSYDSAGLRRAVGYAVERRRSANKLEHLNRVLRSIRNVNQLIVPERDPQRLIGHACDLLVDTRGYSGVWIVLGDDDLGVRATANAGWGADFEPFNARLLRGDWPACRVRVEATGHVVEIEPTTCSGCPLSAAYAGDRAVVALLQRGQETLGLMGVRVPNHLPADEAELDLLREVAGDIAFALHDIHAEGAQQHAHQQYRHLFESMSSGVAVYAPVEDGQDFVIADMNPAGQRICGVARDAVVGRRVSEAFPGVHDMGLFAVFQAVSRDGKPRRHEEGFYQDARFAFWGDNRVFRVPNGQVVALFDDITERKLAREQIMLLYQELEHRVQDQTAELRSSNAELEAFAYSVSHDLRAPLRAIDGFSHALEEDCVAELSQAARSHLERIRSSANRMGTLIDDLLKLSRLTRAAMQRETVRLGAIAVDVVTDLKQAEPGRNIEVRIGDDLTAVGDPTLLRALVQNLLGNAWKFTRGRQPARIQIDRQEIGGEVQYFARDNGAGFDMRYVGKLFGAFQRLHSPREFEGTGIGLATVQRIVRRHGGRVWAEGEVGKGATFYFTLGA